VSRLFRPASGVLASNPWRHVIRSRHAPDRPGASDLDAACPRSPPLSRDGAPVLLSWPGFFHPVSCAIPPPLLQGRGGLVRTNHPPILPAVIDRIGRFNNASVPPQGQSDHVGFGFFPGGKPQAVANPLTGLSSCLRCPGHHSSFHGVGIMSRNLFPLAAAGEGTTPGVGLGPMPTRCRTTLGDLEARGVREGSGEGV